MRSNRKHRIAGSQEAPPAVQERQRQVRGLLLIGLTMLAFSILRAGIHRVFTVGWWRMW